MEITTFFFVFFVVLAAGTVQAVTGFAYALVAVPLLALVTGQVTSYAKARAEAVGATANVGIAERAERLILAGVAVLLAGFGVPYVLAIALWLLGLLGLVTIAQRIWTVRAQLRTDRHGD